MEFSQKFPNFRQIRSKNWVSTMNFAWDFFLVKIDMVTVTKQLESLLFKFIPGRGPKKARFTGLMNEGIWF